MTHVRKTRQRLSAGPAAAMGAAIDARAGAMRRPLPAGREASGRTIDGPNATSWRTRT